MYVESLEGSFFDHDFWKGSFLITTTDQVERLKKSRIAALVIDTEKGLGVTADETADDVLPSATAPMDEPIVGQPISLQPHKGDATQRKATPQRLSPKASPPAMDARSAQTWNARPQSLPDGRPGPSKTVKQETQKATQLINESQQLVVSQFDCARLGNAISGEKLAPIVTEITASVDRNQFALTSLTRLKKKNEYTFMHSIAVCALMVNLAREMDMEEDFVAEAGMAGLLHDIGKMAIPQSLLDKPSALNAEEFKKIRSHPARGYEFLDLSDDIPETVKDACLHHHEKIDGSGYPHQLKGDDISLMARMAAICDVYDAVTSQRPYKGPWGPAEALGKMASWEGHFDPELLHCFMTSLGIYPKGALVKLESNRLAIVMDSLPFGQFGMVVRPFYAIAHLEETDVTEIIIDDTIRSDKIVQIEKPETWYFAKWPLIQQRVMAAPLNKAA